MVKDLKRLINACPNKQIYNKLKNLLKAALKEYESIEGTNQSSQPAQTPSYKLDLGTGQLTKQEVFKAVSQLDKLIAAEKANLKRIQEMKNKKLLDNDEDITTLLD